jgi:hypothetical protein
MQTPEGPKAFCRYGSPDPDSVISTPAEYHSIASDEIDPTSPL